MLNIPVSNPRVAQVITILAGIAAVLVAQLAPTYSLLLAQILTVLGIGAVGVGGASFTGKVPPAVLMLLVVGLCLPLTACSRLASVDWPKQLEVCAAPAESVLLVEVSDVLAGTEDVETALLGLVKSGATKDAVWCAVKQLAADVGFNPSTARAARISARGKAFLDKVASR